MSTTSMPNIYTRDVDAALAFYRDQLGFSVREQFPPEGRPEHVVLQLGDSRLALSGHRAVAAVGLDPTNGNSFELIVWCDDVNGEAARLRAAGATSVVEPYDFLPATAAPTSLTRTATGSRSSMRR